MTFPMKQRLIFAEIGRRNRKAVKFLLKFDNNHAVGKRSRPRRARPCWLTRQKCPMHKNNARTVHLNGFMAMCVGVNRQRRSVL